jgi:hypothetical protein
MYKALRVAALDVGWRSTMLARLGVGAELACAVCGNMAMGGLLPWGSLAWYAYEWCCRLLIGWIVYLLHCTVVCALL